MHAVTDILERVTRAVAAWPAEGETRLPLLPPAMEAAVAWALARHTGRLVVWIGSGPLALETMHQDLLTLAPPDAAPWYLPAWTTLPGHDTQPDPELAGQRLEALHALAAPLPAGGAVLATCIQALMARTVAPAGAAGAFHELRAGGEYEFEDLAAALEAQGYAFETLVETRMQAARRGGLLDLWPPDAGWPLRLEFMGSELESIHRFDPVTQRSRETLDAVDIGPAGEWQGAAAGKLVTAADRLPAAAILLWADHPALPAHAEAYLAAAGETGAADRLVPFPALQRTLRRRHDRHIHTGEPADAAGDRPLADTEPLPDPLEGALDELRPDVLARVRAALLGDLQARAARGHRVYILLDTEGGRDHFSETVTAETGSRPEALGLQVGVGRLSTGFRSDTLELAVVAQSDLYGRRRTGRRYDPLEAAGRVRPGQGDRIGDLSDLEPGDLVVHVEHGIGRYRGLSRITVAECVQEVLTIEYDEGALLHVPVSHAHLLSRYVGIARASAPLHKLGGARWNRDRAAAERAIADLAAQLLETQARRSVQSGIACEPDHPWQHEFEAAFPHRETADQQTVIAAVKQDMEARRPMDRLVCGDAGYGKTEIAMRAAFKAVTNHRQVAVLVPTTVLAQQHYDTFRARMADYPVRIEMLSRFRTRAQRQATLAGMADGSVDIVVGTHALFQPGVRFRELGLVIIDEEQRFGVTHKEAFKHIRGMVDVLTLTATPIPRTLYMSLTGARDLSLLQTPPLERLAIETIVARRSDPLVRQAILRELGRDGQVYYLHNRVMTIEAVADHLLKLLPEARVAVAHGRMAAGELAAIMHAFVAGRFDVLVCTTIIESGMDIPRANTILIDRADRFGIADLYQLRGRVGRSSRKAFAYLLTPASGRLDPDARQRIGAVRKHSSLSAGFHLALRDLEIRGAGNLLGAAQSGHITAIGFGLYCQLLKRTVARLKGEKPPRLVDVELHLDFLDLAPDPVGDGRAACLPYAYIEEEGLRLAAYRQLAEASDPADLEAVRAGLADRFGPPPPPVRRLLRMAAIRIEAAAVGIRRVEVREDKLRLTGARDLLTERGRLPRLAPGTPDARLEAVLERVRASPRWADPPR